MYMFHDALVSFAERRVIYMQNPPDGYTRREIERMRDNDILDMDYFLNEF